MDPGVCPMCFQNYSQERKPMIVCQEGHSICEFCSKTVDHLQPKPFALGGFSQIYKAKWNTKDVVIKRINLFLDEKSHQQFENELKLSMKLEHPSIIQMYGKTEMDKVIGIIMDFANEGDLTQKIPSLTFEEQIDYSLQIIDGIRVLHSNSIIHRDLKPENILVCDNKPKISDFGISKVRENTLKVTSVTISYRYSAPELFQKGGVYDTSCDIFSLSMILYSIFSKKEPFQNQNDIFIPAKIIMGKDQNFQVTSHKDYQKLLRKDGVQIQKNDAH
ncbi:ovarian-specific serine/threonine-protein kinase lok-related [Anaeramoeba ignava]|uniref:Ovarian-specific serine/threonine-protein kinase lok-related n=1 Tax=Anaeramoeba ignava TaxID=1746090 RepID=A0A9Q0RIV6_ANAIG|nr:ovarian-specific serine/threonine-protein kinase lok-related [Anaeramoeba ignava]